MAALDILTEAQALPYCSHVSNKKAKSEDIFIFGNFMMKLSTLSRGVTLYYLKNHTPCLFVLSGYDQTSGAVKRNITSIPQAPQVVATIAEIISKELSENIRTPIALVRLPVNGIKADVVTRIIQRYVRKSSPKFEVTGIVEPNGSRFQFVMIQRKDSDIDMDKVFGVGDNFKLRDVASLPEPTDDVNKAFEKVDTQIKAKTPSRISVSMISGGKDLNDLPENPRKFIEENPSPVELVTTGKVKATQFDPNEEIFTDVQPDKFRTSPIPVRPTTNLIRKAYRKKSEFSVGDNEVEKPEYLEMVSELESWMNKNPITMEDILAGSDVIREFDNKVTTIINAAIPFDDPAGRIYEKQRVMGDILNDGLFKPHMEAIHTAYENFSGDVAEDYVPVIRQYCGMAYEHINKYLLNGELFSTTEDGVRGLIRDMDKAFVESASILPKDTVGYRSMRFPDWLFLETIEDKVFHFRTYVSTSFSPYSGLTFAGYGLSPVSGCEYIDDPESISSEPMADRIATSMVIRDIHLVPTIIPGKISKSPRECEIILPRGTTIRINKVAVGRGVASHIKIIDSAIMDCAVVDPTELDESIEIFDGDELFRTGRLVEYKGGFDGFVRGVEIMKEQKENRGNLNFLNMVRIANMARRADMTEQEKEQDDQTVNKFSSDLFPKSRKPRK